MVGPATIDDHGPMNVPRSIFRIGWAAHRILWRLSGHRLGTARPGKGVGTLVLSRPAEVNAMMPP